MPGALLSGVLPFIYSQGDRLKNKLSQVLADPIGVAQQAAGQIQDSAREQSALMAAAFADPQRPFLPTDSNALAQAVQNVQAGPLSMAPAGITVYHGSPHTFDAFDSSKIGTGEGAQAYGHGLYLAENPKVAEDYRQALSTYHTTLNGQPLTPDHPQFSAAMAIGAKGYDAALKQAQDAQKFGFLTPDFAAQEIERIKALKGADIQSVKQGNVYKVDLPDPAVAKMIDWDKPMSQQPPNVQQAWQATKAQLPPNAIDDLGGDLSMLYGKDVMPEDFLGTMQSIGGNQAFGESLLAKQGVPGVRYLDRGSRTNGVGTSNFVVFPGQESQLQILERNGQPLSSMLKRPQQ